MPELVVLQLSKHYKNNIAGEIASFPPDVAAHIIKADGGTKLAELDRDQRYDVATKKVVPIEKSNPADVAELKAKLAKATQLVADLERQLATKPK
jgi:hypothetical protein